MDQLARELAQADSRWAAAVALLRCWNRRPPEAENRRSEEDFYDVEHRTRARFDDRPGSCDLAADDRAFLIKEAVGRDPWRVDAVGFGLNFAAGAGFAQGWREALPEPVHRLAPGDPYPVGYPPWPQPAVGSKRTPPPWAVEIDIDDHPFTRIWHASKYAVEFDTRLWRQLSAVADNLEVAAALFPNEALDEMVPASSTVAFPLNPRVDIDVAARVLGLLEHALGAGATLVVLPELTGSPATTERIADRLATEEEPRLVVCGSWHERVDGQPANISEAVLSGYPHRMRHRKLTEYGDFYPRDAENRVREGVTPGEPPTLRVYVADGFRFCLLICKDLLDRSIAVLLDRLGVNVLMAPAMSRTTQPLSAAAGARILGSQAVTAVVNGPLRWLGETPVPPALLGRPVEPRSIVEAPHDITAPAAVLFSLVDGRAWTLVQNIVSK